MKYTICLKSLNELMKDKDGIELVAATGIRHETPRWGINGRIMNILVPVDESGNVMYDDGPTRMLVEASILDYLIDKWRGRKLATIYKGWSAPKD